MATTAATNNNDSNNIRYFGCMFLGDRVASFFFAKCCFKGKKVFMATHSLLPIVSWQEGFVGRQGANPIKLFFNKLFIWLKPTRVGPFVRLHNGGKLEALPANIRLECN